MVNYINNDIYKFYYPLFAQNVKLTYSTNSLLKSVELFTENIETFIHSQYCH